MKRILSLLIILFSTSNSYASDFQILSGIGFTAPNVGGTSNVGNPQVGDIIFNTTNSTFYGYGGTTPGWVVLGNTSSSYTAPTVQKFTTPGSGTYNTPTPAPLYIKVRLQGGGGGGGASGANNGGNNGGDTTWASTLLVAGKGFGGATNGGSGGVGGTNSSTAGPIIVENVPGGAGGNGQTSSSGTNLAGSAAGASFFGAGFSGAGAANTGAGGQGGAINGSGNTGAGGGAGGYIVGIITSPSGSYTYAVGSGGSGGTGGTAGQAGGSGAIIVEEYYQ